MEKKKLNVGTSNMSVSVLLLFRCIFGWIMPPRGHVVYV